MTYFIRNWREFQDFKRRRPPWIKLHHTILDDLHWHELDSSDAKSLVMLWLIASEDDELSGKLPDNRKLAFRLRKSEREIEELTNRLSHWISEGEPSCEPTNEGGASRYIPDAIKTKVFDRDGGRCQGCGSTENIEYDRIIPNSQGGSSEEENIQLLCRSCGRRKRSQYGVYAERSSPLRQAQEEVCAGRSPEAEPETETETETEGERGVADAPPSPIPKEEPPPSWGPPPGHPPAGRPEESAERRSRNQGTVCPEDFKPTDKHYATGDEFRYTRQEVDEICKRMIEWSHENANRQIARKARWDLTLHKFIRTSAEKDRPKRKFNPMAGIS
jgi:HNH endonuclease